ncbi:MAG TPA: tetratricopeptide repeat protein, partial [Candidatus Edwardsbacteria bacterium]|nr:tetratricopeptide repeat protein [Candidatus Edwardsbacteria bacterium]
MLKTSLRTAGLLAAVLVLAFFATGCDQFMSSALIYLQQNPPNFEKAIATLNEGLTVVPDHGEYYGMLAFCYYNNHQYKEARESFDKAIKFLPDKKDSLIKVREQDWV